MKRKTRKYPYYEVMKNEGRMTGTIVDTLPEARALKKVLKKAGNDAFIFKVWKDNVADCLYEDVVR